MRMRVADAILPGRVTAALVSDLLQPFLAATQVL